LFQTFIWQCVKTLVPLVNIKIAGKWMFIPLKKVLIGIDPYPYIAAEWFGSFQTNPKLLDLGICFFLFDGMFSCFVDAWPNLPCILMALMMQCVPWTLKRHDIIILYCGIIIINWDNSLYIIKLNPHDILTVSLEMRGFLFQR
jgi:hypothetical protein